jgi:hypothetical protein
MLDLRGLPDAEHLCSVVVADRGQGGGPVLADPFLGCLPACLASARAVSASVTILATRASVSAASIVAVRCRRPSIANAAAIGMKRPKTANMTAAVTSAVVPSLGVGAFAMAPEAEAAAAPRPAVTPRSIHAGMAQSGASLLRVTIHAGPDRSAAAHAAAEASRQGRGRFETLTIHATMTVGIMTTSSRFRAMSTRMPRSWGMSLRFDHWGGVGTLGFSPGSGRREGMAGWPPQWMMARQVLGRSGSASTGPMAVMRSALAHAHRLQAEPLPTAVPISSE